MILTLLQLLDLVLKNLDEVDELLIVSLEIPTDRALLLELGVEGVVVFDLEDLGIPLVVAEVESVLEPDCLLDEGLELDLQLSNIGELDALLQLLHLIL